METTRAEVPRRSNAHQIRTAHKEKDLVEKRGSEDYETFERTSTWRRLAAGGTAYSALMGAAAYARICWLIIIMGGLFDQSTFAGVTSVSAVSVVHLTVVVSFEWQYENT